MDWGWGDLIKTIIGAGIGSALVQVLAPFIRDYRQRKMTAAYMSMRLAVILEAFARECAELIEANKNAQTRPDEEFPDWDVNLPELAPYPDDGDGWRAL